VEFLVYIFKVNPLVMSVPAIQRDDGITVPVGTVIQENGRIALVA
jgi:hypothetical protein